MTSSPARNLLQDLNIAAPYATEARRLLETLARLDPGAEHRSYMITSAGRGEGKSTTCSLLGIVAAKVFHKRTLVIDADLHRPTAHELLGTAQRPGLFEALNGLAPLEKATRATLLPTLWMIPSGKVRGPAEEAYDNERFKALLETVKPAFDLIFIDAAPVVPVVEPLQIARHVDGILVVAMAGRSHVHMVRRMTEILEPVRSKISGIILNNAAEGLPYYYDYRYYGYERRRGGDRRAQLHALPGKAPTTGPRRGASGM